MGPKCFQSKSFSLFIVKFKKLGFSAPLIRLRVSEFNLQAVVKQVKILFLFYFSNKLQLIFAFIGYKYNNNEQTSM